MAGRVRLVLTLVLLVATLATSCAPDPPTITGATGGSTSTSAPLARTSRTRAVTPGSVPAARPPRAPLPADTRVVGYFSSTSMNPLPEDPAVMARPIPEATVGGLTHLIMGVTLDLQGPRDRCAPTNTDRAGLDYLAQLRKETPSLRLLIGINGADAFRDAITDPARRASLIASCTTLLQDRGFDGFDVDWEFPQSDLDRATFVTLMAELRAQLDALRRGHLSLSMATSSSLPSFAFYDWAGLDPVVDWYNVMTYEYGPRFRTALNTPLHRPSRAVDYPTGYSIDDTMVLYAKAEVPPRKMVLGLAFYGHIWHGVAPGLGGLYQAHDAPASVAAGYIDYGEIAERYPGDAHHARDEAAEVPYIYDATNRTFISFDDARSLQAKVAYGRHRGLGGVMIFRVDGDDETSTLFEAVFAALATP